MNFDRRNFIKSACSIAFAGLTQAHPAFSFRQESAATKKIRVAVFFSPSFPSEDGVHAELQLLQEALKGTDAAFLDLDELKSRMDHSSFDLFLNPYGSAFPKDAFATLDKFLVDGGSWVNLGGIPFSVPTIKSGDAWRKEVRTTAYHKKLGITQAFPVDGSSLSFYRAGEDGFHLGGGVHLTASEIYELYVRFTSVKDFADEDGSGGPRDAVLRPIVFGMGTGKRRVAAPVVEIDRFQGEYAGGRWVLANFKGTIAAETIRALVERAAKGSMELVARPSLACYHEGEAPSVTIQFRRPKGNVQELIKGDCTVEILDDRQNVLERGKLTLRGNGTLASGTMDFRAKNLHPGLYQLVASMKLSSLASDSPVVVRSATGFWVFDGSLLRAGKPLTTDATYLLRDGKVYPVTGMTYMGSDVHRKFLFEPNAYLWNNDFSEMKAAGINMVRTGIWTGWKSYMPDVGSLNETALRAVDAFVLTARKHDIPIIFTFFAFLPESWGGANAYLDPRSVNAQKEFIEAFAQRYREVNDIIWDFINEPSFCNPQHLWQCRPNYDVYESKGWQAWLRDRFPASTDEERASHLQELYRATSQEPIGLPTLEEFEDVNMFTGRRPVKVIDYRLFAQDMFSKWVNEMTTVIRGNGNKHQLVTVGQDEAGTYESPGNQFFAPAVNLTCLHNWWLNDDLLWDQVLTTTPGKPNLVEETGVMFYEKMDASPWRSENDVGNLLERKMALSIGAGGAGFIQWIWNTNPFMTLDNESGIGVNRVDGTAKPEIQPLMRIARFISDNRGLMRGRKVEEVLMVIPHSQMFSTRNFATEATKKSVRVMQYQLSTPMAAVSEYHLAQIQKRPKLIILPAPTTINQKCWDAMLSMVEQGSTAVVTGNINTDDHWLPTQRSRALGLETVDKPVAEEEFLSIDGVEYQLSYRGDKLQRVMKAAELGGLHLRGGVHVIQHGGGKILWSPLPVELSDTIEPIVAFYSYAIKQAGIAPVISAENKNSSVLLLPTVFQEAVLCTLLSESENDTSLRLTHMESNASLTVMLKAQRSAMIFVRRSDGQLLSQLS